VLDLGCAPGAWLQVVKKFTTNEIDAIDLQCIDFLQGVNFFQADIFSSEAENFLKGKIYDNIFSDMAPSCCGKKELDHLRSVDLAIKVLELSAQNLRLHGNLCVKIFDGFKSKEIFDKARLLFSKAQYF